MIYTLLMLNGKTLSSFATQTQRVIVGNGHLIIVPTENNMNQ